MSEGKKVLVVEDNRVTAKIVNHMLKKLGYVVLDTVKTGKEAMDKSKKWRPDVVILDFELEDEINGIEVAEEIHSFSQIPIVFLTSHIHNEAITNSYIYVNKMAFKINDLERAMEKALG
jgi:CheY-like chemotaxis protein